MLARASLIGDRCSRVDAVRCQELRVDAVVEVINFSIGDRIARDVVSAMGTDLAGHRASDEIELVLTITGNQNGTISDEVLPRGVEISGVQSGRDHLANSGALSLVDLQSNHCFRMR